MKRLELVAVIGMLAIVAALAAKSLLAQQPLAAPAAAQPAAQAGPPIKALLILGGGYHSYNVQKDILKKGIEARGNIEVTIAYDTNTAEDARNPAYEGADWADSYDIIIHDECTASLRDMDFINKVLQPHKDGKPAVVLHCGMHSFRTEGWDTSMYPDGTPWFAFTGLASSGHGAQLPIDVMFVAPDNPITKDMENWTTVNEELYNNYTGNIQPTATALARGRQASGRGGGRRGGRGRRGAPGQRGGAAPDAPAAQDAQPTPTPNDPVVVWTNIYNEKARVFSTTLGHNNATVADPRYLDLVTRGLFWALGRDIDAEFHKTDEATDDAVRALAQVVASDGTVRYVETNCCEAPENAQHPAEAFADELDESSPSQPVSTPGDDRS